MQIQDFNVSVGEIVPEFNGVSAKDMNFDSSSGRIVFHIIGKIGRKRRSKSLIGDQAQVCFRSVRVLASGRGIYHQFFAPVPLHNRRDFDPQVRP